MDIAVIGAGGSCGRQLCMQLLERRIAQTGDRLQMVTRRGGASETELWGLRADLQDAFDDWGPEVELVFEPEDVAADIVVMMAGETVSTDPGAETDRAARHNNPCRSAGNLGAIERPDQCRRHADGVRRRRSAAARGRDTDRWLAWPPLRKTVGHHRTGSGAPGADTPAETWPVSAQYLRHTLDLALTFPLRRDEWN